jgi:hypothetical protein
MCHACEGYGGTVPPPRYSWLSGYTWASLAYEGIGSPAVLRGSMVPTGVDSMIIFPPEKAVQGTQGGTSRVVATVPLKQGAGIPKRKEKAQAYGERNGGG